LEKLNVNQIKNIIRKNNSIFKIKLTQKKKELIDDLIIHLDYDVDKKIFKVKKTSFKSDEKPKEPKPKEPKPKEPKPKEPKPKEPKPETKQDEKDLKQIADTLLKFSQDEPVSFICYAGLSSFIYLHILARHKNDCVIDILVSISGKELEFINKDGSNLFIFGKEIGVSPDMLTKDEIKERLLNKYNECVKNNKLLVVPFSLKGHQNMLIFNHKLKQIERYEPHGIGTQGKENTRLDNKIKSLVKYFNDNGVEMRFSPSIESCPKIPSSFKKYQEIRNDAMNDKKGLQSFDGTKEQRKQMIKMGNYIIKDPGGFCCMWSYLQMDFRLSNPTLKPNELANKIIEKYKDNPAPFFRKFIRGYTYDLMKKLYDDVGKSNVESILYKKGINTFLNRIFNDALQKFYRDAIK